MLSARVLRSSNRLTFQTRLFAPMLSSSSQARAYTHDHSPAPFQETPRKIGENEDPTIRGEDAKEPSGSQRDQRKPQDKTPDEMQEHGSGSKGGPSTSGAAGQWKPAGGAAGGGKQGPIPTEGQGP